MLGSSRVVEGHENLSWLYDVGIFWSVCFFQKFCSHLLYFRTLNQFLLSFLLKLEANCAQNSVIGKVFAILFLFENLLIPSTSYLMLRTKMIWLVVIVMSLKWLLLVCSEENKNYYSQILSNSSLSELTGKDCNFWVY